jgi:membrane carboxypeptidase/penicillin-binding protein
MDNWFVGFTPQITTAGWVGYDVKTPIGGYQTGTGAATALPIWTEFMVAACENLPPIDFPVPDGIILRDVCDESNMPSVAGCPKTHQEVFTDPADTLESCNIHGDERTPRRRRIRL